MMTCSEHNQIGGRLRDRLGERVHKVASYPAKVDELAFDVRAAAIQFGLRGFDRCLCIKSQFVPCRLELRSGPAPQRHKRARVLGHGYHSHRSARTQEPAQVP